MDNKPVHHTRARAEGRAITVKEDYARTSVLNSHMPEQK